MKRHAVIIGAGIIGASIAYHLSRLGMRVTVFDADGPSAGATGASDGVVSAATKSPGHLMELAIRSKAYYLELSLPSAPLNNAYHECSTFLVAVNDAEIEILLKQVESLHQAGVGLRTLDGPALRAALPDLRQAIPLVLEVMNEGHALGYRVVDKFLRAGEVEIRRSTPVTGLEIDADNGHCVGVRISGETVFADDVVIAAGPSSKRLVPSIDVHPQRGQLIVTDRPGASLNFPGPLFFATYLAVKADPANSHQTGSEARNNTALVIDPLRTGQFLIGSTREHGDDPGETEFSAVQNILRQAVEYVPRLAELDVLRVFAGIRAKTADGSPIVGPISDTPGLWVATGFGGDGVCLAPLVGRELSKLMMGDKTLPEFDQLSPTRFNADQVAL